MNVIISKLGEFAEENLELINSNSKNYVCKNKTIEVLSKIKENNLMQNAELGYVDGHFALLTKAGNNLYATKLFAYRKPKKVYNFELIDNKNIGFKINNLTYNTPITRLGYMMNCM